MLTEVNYTKPTVLVLGAGASKPYGFPLGLELKAQILQHLENPGRNDARSSISIAGFGDDLVKDFFESFKYTQHKTLDAFLEHKKCFRELGSYLIAHAILPNENPDRLFPGHDWYLDFYNYLEFHNVDRKFFELSIVTFNYDRSFEHFMTKAIDYNVQHELVELAHSNREKIKIVHAHGSFGEYTTIPFGMTKPDDSEEFHAATRNIKIVSDNLVNSPTFTMARELINEAGNIVFLGFGYNAATMTSLFDGIEISDKNIFGTSYGLDPDIRKWLDEMFPATISLGGFKMDCAQFMKAIGLGIRDPEPQPNYLKRRQTSPRINKNWATDI
ncbi:MAG: hypothetical protein K9M54_00270 [Kiritimatiellales bacterium]|nr:hypothetical protein [Kiritimatiellales bacterium]